MNTKCEGESRVEVTRGGRRQIMKRKGSSPPILASWTDIELLLTAVGALDRSQVPGAATYDIGNGKDGQDSENEDEGFGGNRRKTTQTIRSQEEDDADLDWDL
jgi:hypothetical protein